MRDVEVRPARSRRIAYHEAGHAVVAWALGLSVGEMRIAHKDGGCQIARSDHLPILERLALCHAGISGGHMSGEAPVIGEGQSDLEMAERILAACFLRGCGVLESWLHARARNCADRLVHEHKAQLDRLAAQLRVRDLSARDAIAILKDSAPLSKLIHAKGPEVDPSRRARPVGGMRHQAWRCVRCFSG